MALQIKEPLNAIVEFSENLIADRDEVIQRPFIPHSPYKGLKRFNAQDKDLFFGRDRLIYKLIEAVNLSNLVLVLGASGSGKSSVVRAGVIPQIASLSEMTYQCCLFTPNRDPFESFHLSLLNQEKDYGIKRSKIKFILEATEHTIEQASKLLKTKHSQWLIFIDQFEELFTICSNLEIRRNFIQGIIHIAQDSEQSVKLILAMRSDFLEELSVYPQFAQIAEKNLNLVADMQVEELRLAIEQPSARHGIVFESGLAEEIIRDVQGQAGSLPLLQYTLDLLWQDEDLSDRTLNIATYRQLGGVTGALQKHVNRIYQQLPAKQQLATRQILLRLVDVVGLEKSEVLRTAVSLRAYKSEFTETQVETVNLLVDQSLLVSNDNDLQRERHSTVEIAHEALLSSWAELKDWIIEARNTISLNNRLAEDVVRWQLLKQENPTQANEELWSGSKLEKVIEFRKDGTFQIVLGGLSDEANNFIDASVDWRDRQIQEKLAVAQKLAEADRQARIEAEKREEEQKKAYQKLRIWSMVAVAFGLIAGLLGISSLYSSQQAQLREQAANIKVKLSLSNEIEHLFESIQLVNDNHRFHQRWFRPLTKLFPDVQSVLYQSVEESRERYVFEDHIDFVNSVAISSDGQYIVSGSKDKTINLWLMKERKLIRTFEKDDSEVNSVAISSDGQYIVSGSQDGKVRSWNRDHQQSLRTFEEDNSEVNSVAISSDGQYIVSGSQDGKVRLWNRDHQQSLRTFEKDDSEIKFNEVDSVAISSNGQYIVSGTESGEIRLWDTENESSPLHTFNGHRDRVHSVAFSPDSKHIVSGSWDSAVKLWDVEKNQLSLVHAFNGHRDRVHSVAFSPDGKYIVSGSRDNTLRLWDVEENQLLYEDTLEIEGKNAHKNRVHPVAFSPNGKYLASGSMDKTVKLWDLASRSFIDSFEDRENEERKAHTDKVFSVAFSPNGKYLASGSWDCTIKLWDVETRSLKGSFEDRKIDKSKAHKECDASKAHEEWVYSVAFNPNGKYLASGSRDKTVKLWDVESRSLIDSFKDEKNNEGTAHEDRVASVAFSPDGQYLVSGSWDNTFKLWDVESRSLIRTFDSNQGKVKSVAGRINSVAFSPDGKYIASGSFDWKAKLWNKEDNQTPLHIFNGHKDRVYHVMFTHDGKYLATGSWDNTVKLWNVENKSLVYTIDGHRDGVYSVALSPDDKYLVSGSWDHTVKLWRMTEWLDWLKAGCERIKLHPTIISGTISSAPKIADTCLKYGVWSNSNVEKAAIQQAHR